MKNKGFTLIELLAVIIILGILMLIAIPSVTSYINNSRKESYVSTIKELIKGTTNIVNSGEIDVNDPNTTYYIPVGAIELENGKPRSPYGEFDEAYVVVTYDGDNFDYYFVGKDDKDMGIEKIIASNNIDKNVIKGNIDNIDTECGIYGKEYIVKFDDDLNPSNPVLARSFANGEGPKDKKTCPSSYTSMIYWALQDNDGDGLNEKLVISDKEVTGALSGSFRGNQSPSSCTNVPWIMTDGSSKPNNLSYNVKEIVVEGNVVPNTTRDWFFDIGFGSDSVVADLSGLNVCKATSISGIFSYYGQNAKTCIIGDVSDWDVSNVQYMDSAFNSSCYNTPSWYVGDLGKWDVSNVTNMHAMFDGAGIDSNSWNPGDLSTWNTSNVTDMAFLFSAAGSKDTRWNVGNLSNWNTSKVTTMYGMFDQACQKNSNCSLGDISKWDTSNVTTMSWMFNHFGDEMPSWSVGNIGKWDVSNVTNMSYMFSYAGLHSSSFNLDISNWNMSKVSNIRSMFYMTGNSSTWNIKIPKTNGNGINNETTKIYGIDSSVYESPYSGYGTGAKRFIVAS